MRRLNQFTRWLGTADNALLLSIIWLLVVLPLGLLYKVHSLLRGRKLQPSELELTNRSLSSLDFHEEG